MSKRREAKSSTGGVNLGNLADVPPEDQEGPDLGPPKQTSVDVSQQAAALLRGFRLHVLQHGALDGLSQFDQFIIRAAREFVEALEQRYNNGEPFDEPHGRLPKGRREGVLASDDELVRFSAKVPSRILARMRGALLYLALDDDARATEQIGIAPEFYTKAVLTLGADLQKRHKVHLTE